MNRRKVEPNPALTTLAYIVSVIAAYALFRGITQLREGTNQDLVDSAPFQTWVAVAAITVVAFVDTLRAGWSELVGDRLRASRPSTKVYAVWFVVFAVVVVTTLKAVGKGGPTVEVAYWPHISNGLLLLGLVTAWPWVVSVWASHGILSQCRQDIPALPPPTEGQEAPKVDAMVGTLLDIRRLIAAAVGRLLILVLGAVLLSGALRGALVPAFVDEKDFPSSAVLIYGAFFTVMLSLALLPLMFAWRQTATMLLEQVYPLRIASTTETVAARERLNQTLDIKGSLFTSPVTLASLLAPLVTSFLAVFIPQIK